jgi:hypothetical protein
MSARAAIKYAFPVTEEDKRRLAVFDKVDLNIILDMVDLHLHPEVFENLMIHYDFVRPHTVAFVEYDNINIISPIVADVRLFYGFISEAVEQVYCSNEVAGEMLRERLRNVPHVMLRPSDNR